MDEFAGKVAVVTGAGSGIGRSMALRFAREGMKVVVADINHGNAEAVASEITKAGGEARGAVVDVSDRKSVMGLADTARNAFGQVHLLCNNAGVLRFAPALHVTENDWDWHIGVNVMGVANGLLAFLEGLVSQGSGHIVNTASIAGLAPSVTPGLLAYTASKYAVVGLTETLRADLQGTGVSASVLCPGGVATNIMAATQNRPDRFGGPDAPAAREVGGGDGGAQAMDPDRVAEIVLAGIRADDLYILTHPETLPAVAARHRLLEKAYEAAAARG